MKRIFLMLPTALHHAAARTARRHGISLGELVRRCLERETTSSSTANPDPFWAFDQVFDSGHGTLAANHDDGIHGPIER